MKEPVPYFLRRTSPLAEGDVGTVSEPFAEEREVRLQDYWNVVRKRGWMISAFLTGVVLATCIGLWLITPVYIARATLLIERRTPQVLDMKELFSESPLVGQDEYDYYKTQYEILKSRSLAAQVIQQLDLTPVLEEQERQNTGRNFIAAVQASIEQYLPAMLRPASSGKGAEENQTRGKAQLIDTYMSEMLEIAPVARTRLVQVGIRSSDPDLAAQVANAHAQAYIRRGLGFRNSASEEAQKFLQENLVELKKRVEKSEAALNRYRREKKIISFDDKENIVVERLADLNRRLTEAEAERITLATQTRLIAQGKYDALPGVLSNPVIHELKAQASRLEAEYTRLYEEFTDEYPEVAQLKAQAEETRRRLRREVQTITDGTEAAYLAALAKEKELRAKMEEQRTMALGLKDAAVEYGILAREADANLQLYNSVLQRMKEMGVAAELRASNVILVDEAEPPLKPAKPRKLFTLLLGILAGLGGGVALAFFAEYQDNTLRAPQEVERYLRLPRLGVVPDFSTVNDQPYATRLPKQVDSPLEVIANARKELVLSFHPLSVVTEAYRELRTAILLSRAEEPPKTLLFTSSVPEEGKTTTALNTAIVLAQMGVRVLVIDADLRRSRCHRTLGMRNGFGLTEVLTGQRETHEVIKALPMQNLFFLGSGTTAPNPTELVGSKKMYDTLTSLREQYDYILIDAPPVRGMSDAVLLSTMVDGVVLVVNARRTMKQLVKEAQARLNYARANILGVVLNKVDGRTEAYAAS